MRHYRIPIMLGAILSIALVLVFISALSVIATNEAISRLLTVSTSTQKISLLQQDNAQFADGTYYGTVAIDKPLALGVLDISLTFTSNGDTLQGTLNGAQSLAFSGSPTFTGQITGRIDGITTTFQIDSAPFADNVSGRSVQRQVTLAGSLLEAGNVIQGIYTETIQGFTPQPLLVGGTFLASRPSASAGGANVALDGANN